MNIGKCKKLIKLIYFLSAVDSLISRGHLQYYVSTKKVKCLSVVLCFSDGSEV